MDPRTCASHAATPIHTCGTRTRMGRPRAAGSRRPCRTCRRGLVRACRALRAGVSGHTARGPQLVAHSL
eukprot:358210-Chlamydomonas_euryale.AAC.3